MHRDTAWLVCVSADFGSTARTTSLGETHMSRDVTPASAVAPHTSAWVAQVWVSFVIAVAATGIGIWLLPCDAWVRGFLGMGLLFTVGSSFSLAKTLRDQHEATSLKARIDDARVSRLIAEHDPLKPVL
jgi:hypothetical protein